MFADFPIYAHYDICRDDMGTLKKELEDLGATHVITYDELQDRKAIKAKVKEWTNGQVFALPYQLHTRSLTRAHRISVSD